ncbi:MAG: hypothetical protein KA159_00935 [Halioglobus sp.]|nr:hypothetical protein [Halioglobus sp.]MBP6724546.1 hypothetical protein [Halioglobus sp.]
MMTNMAGNGVTMGRLRRTLDDLIIAEMFLVQATIESATAIGDGLSALGRRITTADEAGLAPADTIGDALQRLADSVTEPYTSRFKYLRELQSGDN